jgi:hypothetical protein
MESGEVVKATTTSNAAAAGISSEMQSSIKTRTMESDGGVEGPDDVLESTGYSNGNGLYDSHAKRRRIVYDKVIKRIHMNGILNGNLE